eukprot:48558-Chlamydomonas_euryale.AAC.1
MRAVPRKKRDAPSKTALEGGSRRARRHRARRAGRQWAGRAGCVCISGGAGISAASARSRS